MSTSFFYLKELVLCISIKKELTENTPEKRITQIWDEKIDDMIWMT